MLEFCDKGTSKKTTGKMFKKFCANYSKIIMESENENTNFETHKETESEELLSEKALEDDFELDEDLDRLPI